MPASNKRYKPFQFTSSTQNWTSPGNSQLDYEGFVELQHDGGKRVAIDGFEVHVQANITVAGATLFGEDLYRLIRSVTVEQKDKVKRFDDVDGGSLRVYNYDVLGPDMTREHPDFAVGGPTTIFCSFYVPLRKPWCEDPETFSMAAELFKLIRIKMAQNADLSIGASVVTINSASYWVVADCHAEDLVLGHSIDTVTTRDFSTATETLISCAGRVHDLLLFIPGAHGGALLTNLTEINVIEEYQQSQLMSPDLITRYQRERNDVTNLASTTGQRVRSNPFVPDTVASVNVPRAVAAMLATGNRPNEGMVRENLRIKTIQGGALNGTLRTIIRVVEPRTAQSEAAVGKKYNASKATPIAPVTPAGPSPVNAKDAAYLPRLYHK